MPTKSELTYLYSLTRFGIRPGLAVIERLLAILGHPEQQFKSIHVTGTNGKGSTCAMIESVLRTAGYKTALYTSPHLYTFNERIRVNGVNIPDKTLCALVAEIRIYIEKENIQPTFFEFTTALAFLHFARSNIDIAVIEVGMGGRYDATNCITPLLSVITNIGLDHTEYLGPTMTHIAHEKAGIIKEGVLVVTAEKDPDIIAIFQKEAEEKHTSVIRVDDVVQANVLSADLRGQVAEVRSKGGVRGGSSSMKIHLPLLGLHQVENMKTAITALGAIEEKGILTQKSIATGIANVKWEGRLQIVSEHPLIIVDGAHNPGGAHALAAFLTQISLHDVLVFAAKKGKDISDMMDFVVPLFSYVIITEGSYMPEQASKLAEQISSVHPNVSIERNVGTALRRAVDAAPPDGTIVVTGSLYMVADALAYFASKRV